MKLMLCGDVVPTDASRDAFAAGQTETLFGNILDLFARSDRVVVNLECALTDSDGAIRKMGPNLKGPPASARTLRQAGVTDCALANNHVLDFGQQGLKDTVAALDEAGLGMTGIGSDEQDARRNDLIEHDGERIALVAVAEHEYSYALPDRAGVRGFDPFDSLEDIALARQTADRVIVFYHGGKEQSPYPSPRLRKACQAMVRAGADLVLCQHSHCIGCREAYRQGEILYGQGNFHFVKYLDNKGWNEGLMVQVTTRPTWQVSYIPIVLHGDAGIELAAGEDKQRILGELERRSLVLQDEAAWLEGWRDFCRSVADRYRNGISNAFIGHDPAEPGEIFPHYFDCEAHHDVLYELYPTWHRKGVNG
ncbi:MAG: CapA family protein [Eubacteriales bacterium]|jgi:poly-gamma-glutamate synthesis protein (capsule biosynthesis protein)|nr:CapA family protein [Eubacteriales bacterium]